MRGRWDSSAWGSQLIEPTSSGAEVQAVLKDAPNSQKCPPSPYSRINCSEIMKKWTRLTSTLSGMFCGSLNLIDERNTVIPKMTRFVRSTSNVLLHSGHPPIKFLGQLPREAVCTENLTPWSKLLPCGNAAGLAQLVNPLRVFDSTFHHFDVQVQYLCKDESCNEKRIDLKQNLVVVFDIERYHQSLGKSNVSIIEHV